MSFEGTDALLKRTMAFINSHKENYLASGGTQGHIVDLSHAGARGLLPTLLLKTTGRRSGKTLIVPLIYGIFGDEWVVVASKGGAPQHPAWFLNLAEQDQVEFQIATQAFTGSWRLAEAERADIWAYMQHLYPPYTAYEAAAGERVIPLVLLRPHAPVAPFQAEG